MYAGMKITVSRWLFSSQLSNVATYFLVCMMLVKKAMLLYLTQNKVLLLGGIQANMHMVFSISSYPSNKNCLC